MAKMTRQMQAALYHARKRHRELAANNPPTAAQAKKAPAPAPKKTPTK